MGPAVIALSFDPVLRLGDVTVRIETVALAAVILLTLLLAARIAAMTPIDGPYVPPPTLRADDLLFVVLGAVPGAVAGGRIGYALIHADYYLARPAAIVDPAQGSLSLPLAILGGIATAAVIARMIGAPVTRWMHAAALPLLFALAAGKLATVLGGVGQGLPSDLPWATRYLGPGPWGSLGPEIASHPSQAYEAIGTAVVLLIVAAAVAVGVFRARDGSALFVAIGLWAIARAIVAFTWRDAQLAGPFRAEHLILAGVLAVCIVAVVRLRGRSPTPARSRRRSAEVEWPDPERRPTF